MRCFGDRMVLARVVLLSATASLTLAAQSPDYRLADGRAGLFEVGQPVDVLMQRAGPDHTRLVDLSLEGEFTPAIEIRLGDASSAPSVVAQIREWPCPRFQVWELEVYDPRFKTAAGIGVGSTLGDLRRRYRKVGINREENPIAHVDSLRMGFRLSSASDDDSVRVTSIFLPPDPEGAHARYCRDRRFPSR